MVAPAALRQARPETLKDMNRKISILLALLLAFPLLAETRQRYTIKTKPTAQLSRLRIVSNAAEKAAHRVRTFANVSGFAADLTEEEAAALRASGEVVTVEPVVDRFASELGTDGSFTAAPNAEYDAQVTPWGIAMVRAAEVWPVTQGEQVHVAVIDTGIDLQHPDLVHAIAGGYNTFNPSGSPQDDHKHGTHVAGIVAAANNAYGVVGVAPAAKLWAVKVLDHNGRGSTENVIAGIDWVMNKKRELGGRWVINMSLGSNSPSDLEADIISRAYNEDIVLVAAAGNARSRVIDWPAAYGEVIAVSAVGEEGIKASFSSYGRGVSVAAPGVAVPSTILPDVTNSEASVTIASGDLDTWGLGGSGHGTVDAMIVDCGLGRPQDFTVDVRGNIALIQRGEIQFRAKARNAKLAGAAGVIIFNHEPENPTRGWTLIVPDEDPLYKGFEFPITVAVSNAAGKMLQSWIHPVSASYSIPQYGKLNGTSMSTPYVAGTVALMLSAAPDLNPAQVDWILRETANDVGPPGWDEETAAGIADAFAAAAYAAPSKFGLPPPPQTITPRRRSVRR